MTDFKLEATTKFRKSTQNLHFEVLISRERKLFVLIIEIPVNGKSRLGMYITFGWLFSKFSFSKVILV